MTFSQLKLCMAIEQAGRCSDTPRAHRDRINLVTRVFPEWVEISGDSEFPFSVDEVVDWDSKLRKSKPTRIKVDVAKNHGVHCFWNGRNKGPCSHEAECGHLVPNCEGGPLEVANCVIECRSHNNQRREMTVEQYISSDLNTYFQQER